MGFVIAQLLTGSSLQSACVCLAIFLFLVWLARTRRNLPPLPPGPWGIPLLGYLMHMAIAAKRHGKEPHDVFESLSQTYGNIFSVKLGNKLVVVLNDFDVIKKAFQHHDLNDRPANTLTTGITDIGKGVGYSNGEPWKELRRFTFTILRGLGVGKKTFEQKIVDEAQNLNHEISLLKGASIDIHEIIEYATTNVVSSILIGKCFDYNDEKLKRQLELQHRNTQLLGAGGILIFMPTVLSVLATKSKNEYVTNLMEILNFHEQIVLEHQKTFDANNLRDYIDVYLLEMQRNEERGVESHLTLPNLVMTLGNMFFAGTGTVCEVLTWAIMFVTAFPDVQKRIHDEIDRVMGTAKLPTLSNRSEMPFTQAVMLESLRLGTIQPIGLPHVAANDTTIEGYTIPKGSFLMPNIWSVHHDPKLWTDPEKFNPERFLTPDGKLMTRPELIPFGTGRRMCLGEQLGRIELFIIFSHLLQRFTFTTPDNDPPIQLKGVFSLNYVAAPFNVRATERHQ